MSTPTGSGTRDALKGPRALLLIAVALGGCGEAGSREVPERPTADWSLVEELRIGAVDGGDQNLTRVEGILPLPDGGAWILQVNDHNARVYSAAGEFVRTVGQFGQAPGEFILPDGIGWWGTTRDTIWIKDNERRITLFTVDGAYARSFRWELGPYLDSFRINEPEVFLPDGTALGLARKTPPRPLLDSRVIRYDAATAAVHGEAARLRRIESVRSTETTSIRLPIPYHELVAYSPDGSWLAVVDRAARGLPEVAELPVHALSSSGDTLWSRVFTYQPIEIPRTLIDSLLDARTDSRFALAPRTGETREQARAWFEERYTFPGHRPPIENAVIGQDGRLWLEWTGPEGTPWEWWVLDEQGRPEARVVPPKRIVPYAADADGLWAVEEDALDVPFVVRYRIDR